MVLLNVQLSSEVGIDYTPLKDILAQGEWKAASRETTRVMVVATRHTSDSPLKASDLAKLPGLDLRVRCVEQARFIRGIGLREG